MRTRRLSGILFLLFFVAASTVPLGAATVHTYYVAADEVEWNDTPMDMNGMTGEPFAGYAKLFTEAWSHRIGSTYRKAIFREYTDETFTALKPRTVEWEHLGILGPVLRAEVGDTIKVVFKNNATRPYGMHPHGVFYAKESEVFELRRWKLLRRQAGVPAGQNAHLYLGGSGTRRPRPQPSEFHCVVSYHSHTNELKDVESGLIGAMIISRKGMAGPTGRPKDVDREFVSLFMIYDENNSWYLQHNIDNYTSDPKGVKQTRERSGR